MIQRIQTLWLLVAAALAVLSFKFSFYSGESVTDGTAYLTAFKSIPILAVTVTTIVLSLITIFMYKSRRKQLWLTILNLLVSIGLILLYIMEVNKRFQNGGGYMLASVFVFLIPVFLFLAIRSIIKDIRLLKSADRLRK